MVELATFSEGDTLIRTRVDLQLTGIASALGSGFPTQWGQAQVEVALLWDQGAGGPPAPPGYFHTSLYPWIWAQQMSFENMTFMPSVSGVPASVAFTNTAESRSIDCHSERLTSPGNSGALWLVLDAQYPAPAADISFLTFNFGYSALIKLAP